ncbi:probable pectinesterase/pectinesterase inhibitor 21 [Impatiens glandulifera]|uniref:probable pectinesterase/pectinesterase inhibitor 21 n=1 Tax=Impatiens glandulifera TaxID=253017 RepID=UPI001FB06E83|nr:probable pectinesterase/pectinesterase inhibitor 21 [Impatiens glandulifera]
MNRLTIIGISSLLLVAMVIGVALTFTGHEETYSGGNSSGGGVEISETAKAVQAICQPTDFKDACTNTLASSAGDTTDPKDLIRISFDIVIQHVGVALNKMDILKDAEEDPLTHAAYVSCKELLEDSVDDLHQTVDSFDTFDLANLDGYLDDVKTWLSGALTFQGTCLDGFENTTGDAGENMKQLLKMSGELTRNGLAMVDEFSKTLAGFNLTGITGRRLLLSDDMNRRLVQATDVFDGTLKPDVVVAKDGSGDCTTIAEGLAKVPEKNNEPFVILVKAGVYEEYVEITKNMSYVMLLGEGPTKTRITGNKNIVDGIPTFKTSTFSKLLIIKLNHLNAQ